MKEKGGYVGLIQFGKVASLDLKVKRSELMKMSAEKQLDYVENWFLLKNKKQLKSATDIYLLVNYPKASGKGHLDNEVVYGDPKAAYRANRPILREKDEIDKEGKRVGKKGGKTYIWEIKEALDEYSKIGSTHDNINKYNPIDVTIDKNGKKRLEFKFQGKENYNCKKVSDEIIKLANLISEIPTGNKTNFGVEAHFQFGLENDSGNKIVLKNIDKRQLHILIKHLKMETLLLLEYFTNIERIKKKIRNLIMKALQIITLL